MSSSLNPSIYSISARSVCVLPGEKASTILCHRLRNGREEYLVRWKPDSTEATAIPRVVCSWHHLAELTRCLHLVQEYVEAQPLSVRALQYTRETTPGLSGNSNNKRKRSPPPGTTEPRSRDAGSPLLVQATSNGRGGTPGTRGVNHSVKKTSEDVDVYNGYLERREGRIYAVKNPRVTCVRANALSLPTSEMKQEASMTPIAQAERAVREAFHQKIQKVPYLFLENEIDSSTPPLSFEFVNEYKLRQGVYRAPMKEWEGCQRPCRPDMGQRIGCEYTQTCTCLEYAAVDEERLLKKDPEKYYEYRAAIDRRETIETMGMPKRFPYRTNRGSKSGVSTLQPFYRESRNPVYECNANCNCGDVCKSRVVQKGRKVPLTIFKTRDRGWGVYCNEDLIQGEFIDTYLGEIITGAEADRREARAAGKDKASYMYSLDKFVGDDPNLTEDTCYVVDGQHLGGATRFINHCCEPNCRQYTVSYNRHDIRVYDLAFFAYEDIPAGTELTFDYMDKDEEEEEEAVRRRELAASDPLNKDKIPCNCGARKCRGYLWV